MLDPHRITRILEKLRIIWQAHDAERLGQLITNLSGRGTKFRARLDGHDWESIPPDLWNIYDEEWEGLLDKTILKMKSGILSSNGKVYYLDKDRMVTRDELYED